VSIDGAEWFETLDARLAETAGETYGPGLRKKCRDFVIDGCPSTDLWRESFLRADKFLREHFDGRGLEEPEPSDDYDPGPLPEDEREERTETAANAKSLRVVGADEFASREFPPREMILSPYIEEKSIGLFYAPRGTGKTIVGVGVSMAVSSAKNFLLWKAPKARRVLYIDGELPRETLQRRIRDVGRTASLPVLPRLRLLTPDEQDEGVRLPDLATPEGRAAIDAVIEQEDPALVVLDNLSTLVRGGLENETEAWQPIQDWLIMLRSHRRSVLMLHHTGKSGEQRGASKREDVIDYSIALKRPESYSPEQGARFEVHFAKARDLSGDGVAPFEARMADVWTILDLSEKAKQCRAEHKRSQRVEGLAPQIEDLLRAKGRLSQNAIENEIEGRRDDIRAALRGLKAQRAADFEAGPRGAILWFLIPLNRPRPEEAKS
jgi:hypothetical protein